MNKKNNGKLSSDLLKKIIFSNIGYKRKEVLTTPFIGQDCGYFDAGGDDIICITTDPITATSEDIGKLAVMINLNDIAAAMATPFAVTVTVMMPITNTDTDVEKIMLDISSFCKKYFVQVIGGHTEFTNAVGKPIVSITALGKIDRKRYFNASKAKSGSYIYVSKTMGLEGSYIIVREKYDEMAKVLSCDEIQEAISYIDRLSVIKDSSNLFDKDICTMHDITEGGLLGALSEISDNVGLNYELYEQKIPITKVTKKICDYYEIDPLKLISSGSMMIISNETLPEKVGDISYSLIGKFTDKIDKTKDDKSRIVTDEIYKVL